jgi:metal-responsive CopG/Arc/MetJ family transcriptional regulator
VKDVPPMTAKCVKVVLNQQQLELLDKTIARGIAPDRETLIRAALNEFFAKHGPSNRPSNTQPVR